MMTLGQVVTAVENYHRHGVAEVKKARTNSEYAGHLIQKWRETTERIGHVTTPTGLRLPRLALPDIDDPGEIARFLWDEGLPGKFPFVTSAYPEQYLEPVNEGNGSNGASAHSEEPTRLFAGLGLADDTNARFHYLGRNQRSKRLSTAFDGPTLYGVGAAADGVFGKIGEGGVAIDTVEDMERLYAGFELDQPNVSVSM